MIPGLLDHGSGYKGWQVLPRHGKGCWPRSSWYIIASAEHQYVCPLHTHHTALYRYLTIQLHMQLLGSIQIWSASC